jgi:hypothetical protein
LISDHHAKASLIWEEYRDKMGHTINPKMLFNLSDLIVTHNLDDLPVSFSHEDIDRAVKLMPTDKAPGPDGFNGAFFKKYWDIIKTDIYQLCDEFFLGVDNLQPINNSYITLIPKVNNPTRINDCRLITLSNIAIKIITKLLGNSLHAKIIPLIHEN